MRDLRLVALSSDQRHLVLEDSDASQYRIPIDQRLGAALCSAAPPSGSRTTQLEIPMESALSPREIQSRIRAGAAAEEVAREAGVSVERVERYASPVVAERAHVVATAQKGAGRRASGGRTPSLLELVTARAAEQGVAAESLQWDAWRPDDAAGWTVQLSYLAQDRARTATWSFDPRGRVLSPVDDEARWLVDEPGTPRESEGSPAAVRRLSAVPAAEQPELDVPTPDEVYDREADERRSRETVGGHVQNGGQAAAAARPAKRPSVPSWDDIMFGPRKRD